MKLNIEFNNLLDIINLNFGVYYPLNEFVSKENFLSIVKKKRLINNKFFSIPIFINISSALYNKLKTSKTIEAFYKSKKVCNLKIKSFYTLNKIKIGEDLFQTKDTNHPGFYRFLNSGDYFYNNLVLDTVNKLAKIRNLNLVVGNIAYFNDKKNITRIWKKSLDKINIMNIYKKGATFNECINTLISFTE